MTEAQAKTPGADAGDKSAAEGGDEKKVVDNKQAANDGGGEKKGGYRPEGLADHYYGATDQETIDKLNTAVAGFRKDQAKGSPVPEKIEDYKIELKPDLAEKLLKPGEDGKDPVFDAIKGVLHKHKLSPEAGAAVMEEIYGSLNQIIEAGGGDEFVADVGYKQLGGADKAKPMIDANNAWITGLMNNKKISEAAGKELQLLCYHGEGLAALEELRISLGGEKPIPADLSGSNKTAGGLTEEKLHEMMRDPRYWQKGKKDDAFIQSVTEGFQKLYAEG